MACLIYLRRSPVCLHFDDIKIGSMLQPSFFFPDRTSLMPYPVLLTFYQTMIGTMVRKRLMEQQAFCCSHRPGSHVILALARGQQHPIAFNVL
jgi:hypothetical protein